MKKTPVLPFPAALFALIAAQAVFATAYVGHERTIYFWDHAMYFGMAKSFYETWTQDAGAAWTALQNSFGENYNYIFTLPALLTFSVFGVSRSVFILTNFFVFFVAYECALGLFLARAIGIPKQTAFILSFVTSSLIPPLWLPLLEGYPDNGAAACITLAAALGWAGPFADKFVKRAIGVGLSLAGAVILRRHFAYPAEALLLTLGCLTLWDIIRTTENRWRLFLRATVYYGICGIALAGLLGIIAPAFIMNALTIDYNALYQSYRRPPELFLAFILGGFGSGLLLAACGGFVFLARLKETGKRAGIFVSLFLLFWFLLWSIGPDQMGHHYMLHCLPLAISAGLAGWYVFYTNRPDPVKNGVSVGLLLLLTANSAWALWLSPTGVWPNDNGQPGLMSAARPPVVRSDLDQWAKLTDYLARTTKPDDRIMVVGSSFVFNQDIFHTLYMDNPASAGMMFRFPKSPEIDHEEPAPLDVFASSTVYIVPTPTQYHLDPSGQRVVTAAAKEFPPPPERENLFTLDDTVFHLENGTVAKIWRRKVWTPASLRPALAQIRWDAAADPQFNQDWVAIGMPLRTQIFSTPEKVSFVSGLFDPMHPAMKLFFDRPLASGDGRLAFVVTGNCPEPKFHLSIVTADGHEESSKKFAPVVVPGELFQPFSVADMPDGDHFLELSVAVPAAAFCHAELRDLRVEKN